MPTPERWDLRGMSLFIALVCVSGFSIAIAMLHRICQATERAASAAEAAEARATRTSHADDRARTDDAERAFDREFAEYQRSQAAAR